MEEEAGRLFSPAVEVVIADPPVPGVALPGRRRGPCRDLEAVGNTSLAEAARSAHTILAAQGPGGTVTTRQVAAATGTSDSVVRPVMLRLTAAGLLSMLPKTGQANGPQLFARRNTARWDALVSLLDDLNDPAGQTGGRARRRRTDDDVDTPRTGGA